jgi:hypothetical protein
MKSPKRNEEELNQRKEESNKHEAIAFDFEHNKATNKHYHRGVGFHRTVPLPTSKMANAGPPSFERSSPY